MCDIGGDEQDPLEGAAVLEVASISFNELDYGSLYYKKRGKTTSSTHLCFHFERDLTSHDYGSCFLVKSSNQVLQFRHKFIETLKSFIK